jgi:ligand-binding sensor domain-containing protein
MRLVIIILLLFYAMKATALSPAVRFEHLSINEGLSQNTVVSIVQDNQGFLWFGTEDGLNRYDGYQFKLFLRQPLVTTRCGRWPKMSAAKCGLAPMVVRQTK